MWPENTEARKENYIEKGKRQKSRTPRFQGEGESDWCRHWQGLVFVCVRGCFSDSTSHYCSESSRLKRNYPWFDCALTAFPAPAQVLSLRASLVES